jgi:hypothetical protein
MTIGEKIELALIPVLGIGVWLMASALPDQVGVGRLFLAASALLLFQSLVRDLWLLARKKRMSQSSPRRAVRCMCIESTVGATGIVVGAILLSSGITRLIVMDDWVWSVLVMLIMGVGFVTKDYVLEWSPWRIRRDKDHMNIVFTWKT